ncbi:FAD binding domain-containing protein [Nocardioides taihuensis]|uniref:FAD binding domain-containing protein n=1 Tax=Nocardioides taihuensis TaxID=1835606 RepID=A0ABW0BG77_9ACTN
MASPVQFHAATSLDDALERLERLGPDARVLAGGTDVMIQLHGGQISARELVHIEGIPGLAELTAEESGLSLGAMVTHENIWRHPVAAGYASLSEAARQVGGWQTQTLGTVVGNVVNASPAADLVPGLLVHDAVLHLAKRGSERTVPIGEFILGRRQTAREAEELVTRITTGPLPAGTAEAFVKVGRRRAMEVSILAVAARLTIDPSSGTITDARVAVGAASAVPYRAVDAERLLVGAHPGDEVFREAGRAALDGADPIDDVRASRRYRLTVLPRAVERALARAAGRTDETRSAA